MFSSGFLKPRYVLLFEAGSRLLSLLSLLLSLCSHCFPLLIANKPVVGLKRTRAQQHQTFSMFMGKELNLKTTFFTSLKRQSFFYKMPVFVAHRLKSKLLSRSEKGRCITPIHAKTFKKVWMHALLVNNNLDTQDYSCIYLANSVRQRKNELTIY